MNRAFIVLALVLTAFSCHVGADILTLRDGSTVEGRILSETRSQVVIETMVMNIKTTRTFRRAEVRNIERKPLPDGFFEPKRSTGNEPETPSDEPDSVDAPPAEVVPTPREPRRQARRSSRASRYAVISLSGVLGEEITGHMIDEALTAAKRRRVQHVVLSIDISGGYAYEAINAMESLERHGKSLDLICVIEGSAESVAAAIVAGCDRVFVRPGSSLAGSTPMVHPSLDAVIEADRAHNQAWGPETIEQAISNEHPIALFRAITDPDAQLWLSENGGFSTSPDADGSVVASAGAYATLTASELVASGFAQLLEGEIADLHTLIGIDAWSLDTNAYERILNEAYEEREALEERMAEAERVYDQASAVLAANDPMKQGYTVTYGYVRGSRTKTYWLDGDEKRRWQRFTDISIQACDRMLAAMEESKKVYAAAQRIGAAHIWVSESGLKDQFELIQHNRSVLTRDRLNPPAHRLVNP